ncbi:MAG: sensor histidine kinase [Cyanobacteria bacterium J06629_18]
MNERVFSLPKVLRYLEWTILIVILLVVLLMLALANYFKFPAYPDSLLPFFMVFVSLAGCGILSIVFPVNRPLWQIRLYIFLEMLLIIPTVMMGVGFEILLYFYIGKSCFLLSRKDVLFTAIASCIVWNILSIINFIYRFDEAKEYLIAHLNDVYVLEYMIPHNLIIGVSGYSLASIFVIMFCYLALAEQKSRKKAEKLAQEVEALASKLERHRIARDIHDSLGHSLTTLDVQLELANKLAVSKPENALKTVNICKQLSSQCLVEVRRAVRTMRDSTFNLHQALQTLVEQVQQNQNLDIYLEINLPNLPLQTAHQLYCIAKEGLTNIQKHADASQVTLKGEIKFNNIVLQIIDNGKGFNFDAPHSGFGLKGMQERVDILAGEMIIDSRKIQGTCINILIPF